MKCGSCLHFEPIDNGKKGHCLEKPPVLFPVPVQGVAGMQLAAMGFTPQVTAEHRCGQWKAAQLL